MMKNRVWMIIFIVIFVISALGTIALIALFSVILSPDYGDLISSTGYHNYGYDYYGASTGGYYYTYTYLTGSFFAGSIP